MMGLWSRCENSQAHYSQFLLLKMSTLLLRSGLSVLVRP